MWMNDEGQIVNDQKNIPANITWKLRQNRLYYTKVTVDNWSLSYLNIFRWDRSGRQLNLQLDLQV